MTMTIFILDLQGNPTILKQPPTIDAFHSPWWVLILPDKEPTLILRTKQIMDLPGHPTILRQLQTMDASKLCYESEGRQTQPENPKNNTNSGPPLTSNNSWHWTISKCTQYPIASPRDDYKKADLEEPSSPVKELKLHSEHWKTHSHPSPPLVAQSGRCWTWMHQNSWRNTSSQRRH